MIQIAPQDLDWVLLDRATRRDESVATVPAVSLFRRTSSPAPIRPPRG